MKRAFIILIVSNFLTLAVQAQDSTRVWTLEECIEYAVERSATTRNQQLTAANYRQDVLAAVGQMLPSVSGSMSADWGFGRSIDPQTNTYDNTSNFNNRYSLGASMPLLSGLVYLNQLRAARIAKLRGDEQVRQAEDRVAMLTLQAYVEAVYCSESARIAAAALETSHRSLYTARRQAELGLRSMPDVAQLEAEVAGGEYTLTQRQNLLGAALLNLKERMNYPYEQPLNIAPDIAFPGEREESNAAEIYAAARRHHPDALIADYSLRESQLSLAMTRGQYYPSLSASASIGTNFFKNLQADQSAVSFREQWDNNQGKSIGLSLRIPIFGGLSQRTRVAKARNNLRIAEQNHHEQLRALQREIEQAVMDVEGYAKEYAQAIRKAEATQAAHRANQRRFEEGLISALELQTSTNLLLEAQMEELGGKLRYRMANKMLDFYR